jgi:hypothetical protein
MSGGNFNDTENKFLWHDFLPALHSDQKNQNVTECLWVILKCLLLYITEWNGKAVVELEKICKK